ncbi:spellchecker1 [Carabus blaptoides fortunei]
MNFIQDNLVANNHNEDSKSDAIMRKNQILGTAVLGPPRSQSQDTIDNRHQVQVILKCRPRLEESKPKLGSAAMKSGSSRLTVNSQVVVALCEGRGQARGIVGIAAMDINKPVLVLCELSDTQTYTNTLTKVNILRPVEVLIPSSFVECTTPSRIFTLLKDQFPNLTVSSVSRSAFRSNRGLSYVKSLCAPEFKSVTLVIREKFYALASASALIKYIQKEQHIMYPTRSIKIEYQEPEDTAVIDIDSADRLELVSSCNHEERAINLLSMLDHCVTGVGKKMLRATILQPPCIDHVTQARLDCVQELVENAELRIKLKGVLANLHNIECALMFGAMVPQSAAAVTNKQVNYAVQLKTILTNIEPLRTELEGTYHPLFRRIHEQLVKAQYSWLLEEIDKVLIEEALPVTGHVGDLQRCFVIRTGLNGSLDVARRTYDEVIDDMLAYIQHLRDKYSLPLRTDHTPKRGSHIVLNLTGNIRKMKKSSLPSVFVKVEKNTTQFTMTTSEMTSFGVRRQIISQEIKSITNVIIYQLMGNIRKYIADLYTLCDDVALLDILQSLATVSTTSGYIRPKFSTEHMEIIGARHPLLEYSSVQEPVSNNIVASDLYNLHIVTGPNMSGKSIYARQMPLLQVLAQIGCYVPAQSAIFRSCTHVYARISLDDYLHDNSSSTTSTFVREMTEVQYMLNTLDTGSRSLVILDELCHSTSVDEGISIAIAICEELLKTKAYIFVATHFLSMTKLAGMYYSVSNSHLETVETIRDTRKCIKFTHRLIAGKNGVETYGIKLLRICDGSDMLSNRAEEILHDLLPTHKTIQSSACPQNITYLKHRLYADLKLLQLQNKLSAEVERKRLDEHEKLTGEHYEIGQVLSVDKVPSRTPASRGPRTTRSSSTADTSDKQKSKPSTSVYDTARKTCKPGAIKKPINKSTDNKIVDSLIPSEADFLYCITADSPELDCADSEHSDPLGVTVKHLDPQSATDAKREKDGLCGDKSLDYDSDSPMYSPNFNLYSDMYSPLDEPYTPDSEASIDIMNSPPSPSLNSKHQDLFTLERKSLFSQRSETNSLTSPSFEPQTLSSKPSEPINLDTNLFGTNVPPSNIFETKSAHSVLLVSKSPHCPSFEITDYEEERKKIEEVLKDDDDEVWLLNFQQDHLKQDPIPAPMMQRPREGVLSAIMNPKKKSKRKSRNDKDVKNELPFEHYKQPAKTRTKRVSSPLFKHEKKTAKQQLTVPEPYVPPRRAKTAKLSLKTPCYLEEPPKEQNIKESQARATITSRQEMNLPDTMKSRLSWSEILSVPPAKLVDYNNSVVSGKGLMKQPMPDEDLASTEVTSTTPLSSKCNTKGKTKMINVFRRTFTKQECKDMLLESSDESLSNDDLDIHCRSKVGDACPKKPTKTDLIS